MSFSYEYLIQFRDTDAAGVVYFASILSICHIAYEASLIESGIDLKLFVNNPEFAVPITHASADFFKPLYCGDQITIELTPRSIDSCRFEINYQLSSATAITKHIVIDPSTRKRKELPAILTSWLGHWG
ncbi:MAG: acyl-CoA thioesterase [Chamaesiphon sp.]|nr:acyl-CoA thioesterase [Chamaesiphon sp.]